MAAFASTLNGSRSLEELLPSVCSNRTMDALAASLAACNSRVRRRRFARLASVVPAQSLSSGLSVRPASVSESNTAASCSRAWEDRSRARLFAFQQADFRSVEQDATRETKAERQ